MNRRGTEPYARWCERPGRETSPAYSIAPIMPANRSGDSYLYRVVTKAFAKPTSPNDAVSRATILSSR